MCSCQIANRSELLTFLGAAEGAQRLYRLDGAQLEFAVSRSAPFEIWRMGWGPVFLPDRALHLRVALPVWA